MKFFIWFAFIMVYSIIATALRTSDIILGGIPTALLWSSAFVLATICCRIYDKKKFSKEHSQEDLSSELVEHIENCRNEFLLLNDSLNDNLEVIDIFERALKIAKGIGKEQIAEEICDKKFTVKQYALDIVLKLTLSITKNNPPEKTQIAKEIQQFVVDNFNK